MRMIARILAVGSGMLFTGQTATAAAVIQQIPGLVEGGSVSVEGLSADGTTVVGYAASARADPWEAFRWTDETGTVALGDLPGGIFESRAKGASGDGAVVVGTGNLGTGGGPREAFRWTQATGLVGLGDLDGGAFYSAGLDISADASTIVGAGESANGQEAFRWTATEGMVGLGDLPGGTFQSQALAVSNDGSVIVGLSESENGANEAFRWTASEGMVGLGDLLGLSFSSYASAVSAEGTVVVGRRVSSTGLEAFRWTAETGLVGLGVLPGESEREALDVTADGSIVVGRSLNRAFIWDDVHGMRDLKDVLTNDFGLDLTNWNLTSAEAISDDGRVIAGPGWLVIVPEPCSASLLGVGLACLAIGNRGRLILVGKWSRNGKRR